MSPKELVVSRISELNVMATIKRGMHDKLCETKRYEASLKHDTRRTVASIKHLNSELMSIDNMIILNEVVLATC